VLKQVSEAEALQRYLVGQNSKCIVMGKDWNSSFPTTLSEILKDVIYLVDEDPEEQQVEQPEMNIIECSMEEVPEVVPAEEVPEKKKNNGGAKKYDEGKIRALLKAGWTFRAVADEMKCAENTVRYYADKMRKEEQSV
jgi:hypothetical protein